jgi:uncharacterized protein (TIGR02466 family)
VKEFSLSCSEENCSSFEDLQKDLMIEADWLENSDVFSLFPTLVWKIQLPVKFVIDQNSIILKTIREIHPGLDDVQTADSWQSHQLLHEEAELGELMTRINSAAEKVLRFLKVSTTDIGVTGCWANVSGKGASHRTHCHPNNYLSGVYYVRAPAGANTINFQDPRPQVGIIRPPVTQLTGQNTDQVVVDVTDGTLLLFPSYLQHSVDASDSHELRISISFNLMFSEFAEKLSTPLWESES